MPYPTVSVIVPSYNHASFLERRLESILKQSFQDLEVIILDDCSSDESPSIIKKIARQDKRIRAIYNKTNSGSPFHQWKKGIEMAAGDFLWIAESDDFADLEMLSLLLDALERNPTAGIAYCQSYFADQHDNVIGNHLQTLSLLDASLWLDDFCMNGKYVLANHMPVINIIPNVSAALFRKHLCKHIKWEEVLSYILAGDRHFWCSLLYQTNLCFISRSMNYFRTSDKTIRSGYLYEAAYLNEIVRINRWIVKRVKVPFTVKNKALRQWFRTFATAFRNSEKSKLSFVFVSVRTAFDFLGIYFTWRSDT